MRMGDSASLGRLRVSRLGHQGVTGGHKRAMTDGFLIALYILRGLKKKIFLLYEEKLTVT